MGEPVPPPGMAPTAASAENTPAVAMSLKQQQSALQAQMQALEAIQQEQKWLVQQEAAVSAREAKLEKAEKAAVTNSAELSSQSAAAKSAAEVNAMQARVSGGEGPNVTTTVRPVLSRANIHRDDLDAVAGNIGATSYTLHKIVVFFVVIIYCYTYVPTKSGIESTSGYVRQGNLLAIRTPDAHLKAEDIVNEFLDKLDPKAAEFIAPGNIYRMIAILSPEIVGMRWFVYLAQGLICCFTQIALPMGLITGILSQYKCDGLKRPEWYVNNLGLLGTEVIALISLSNIFYGRVRNEIVNGATANYYILTHRRPLPVGDNPAMHHAEDRDLVFSRAEEDPPEGAHPPAGGPPQKADVEKAAGSEDFQALLLARKMSPNKLAETQ